MVRAPAFHCSVFEIDMNKREILLGMTGYLQNVMYQSDPVGFGMHPKFQSLQELFLICTTNQLVETAFSY